MSDIIQLLPDSVANQIAAGEVIQRPASVVKELMENAIDAGATSVQVILKDAGRTLIQVIDNGKGMSMTDARMAFERHATSKIRKADDLFALQTMGFRGEALASIAAIAQVELRTRREEDELGTSIRISGTEVENQESIATPVGSSFLVKNIFYNVPARRKFLKSNQTELSNIISEFERIALVNPKVSFTLHHNDNEVLNLPATIVRQRIINTFGKSLNQQLLTVEVDTALISVTGYIGRPEAARKKNALQYFFVNGRYMRHPYFHKAIMQSYEKLIPQGEQPNYFLYFTIDPANIDVNIHPTKTEIKFENESFLWQIICAAVKEALGKFSAVPSIDFDMADAPDIPVHKSEGIQPPKPKFDSGYNPFQKQASASRVDPNWQKMYGGFQSASDTGASHGFNPFDTTSDFETQSEFTPEETFNQQFQGDPDYFHTDTAFPDEKEPISHLSAASLSGELIESKISSSPFHGEVIESKISAVPFQGEVIETQISAASFPEEPSESKFSSAIISSGEPSSAKIFSTSETGGSQHYQFKGKYILTSVKSGLMMIDQHRAHVRVLFDRYMENIVSKKGVSQGVLFPEMLTFAPADVPILEEILEDLQFLGFDLNNMGGCTYAMNGIPAGIEGLDVSSLIHGMIDTAKQKGRDVKTDLHEITALSLAEAAAIPYGEVLNMDEMENLIDDLFASSSPNNTPDGKLILSVITNDEIGKRFK
ncbi:MAG: DNA mismatch repair endonuclease MutL [Bacteroidales bacterium]